MTLSSTKNFNTSEFACKHCGENQTRQQVIDLAQKIRDFVGVPIRINSGYRCPFHNKRVGGVANSYHVQGLAADLSSSIGAPALFSAIRALHKLGAIPELSFCLLYRRQNFVHVDIGKTRKGGIFHEN